MTQTEPKPIIRKVEVDRPHCPLCKSEIKGTGRYVWDDEPSYTLHAKECDCSIWGWEQSYHWYKRSDHSNPLDRYIYWNTKE